MLALLVLLAGLPLPAGAIADGDPASDVLLGQNVFYPYGPTVVQAVGGKLDAETAAAKRAGFPLKVALIGAPTDLGTVPSLFGEPQAYARFLEQEISFSGPQPLLVVMPAGYGVQGVKAPADLALRGLAKPAGATGTDLARAAAAAVTRLANASGHRLDGDSAASSAGGGGSLRTLVLVVLILAAIVVASALVALRVVRASS